MAIRDALSLPETNEGILLLVMTALGGLLLLYLMLKPSSSSTPTVEEEAKAPAPLRNFTRQQLLEFDGRDEATPAYVALRGEVFDVSKKPQHYKKGGAYNLFAGHDASFSLATQSLETTDLDRSWADLNAMEIDNLDGWVEKFKHYSEYPIVGKIVNPPEELRQYSLEELRPFDGTSSVPDGYAAAPILVGVQGQVFDMSYGGTSMYGPGNTYNLFAGRDASVALAKMSFAPEYLNNPDMNILTTQDLEILQDWSKKLSQKYPVVGRIANSAP